MSNLSIRQEIIEKLTVLNSNNKILRNAKLLDSDLSNLKTRTQQDLDKLKKYARAFKVVAYICFGITTCISFIKIFSGSRGPDLNKAALLIFLTLSNMFTAFIQHIKIEKLEKQMLLINLLEETVQEL